MSETIRRLFVVEVIGDGDPARHQVTSRDEVNQLLDHRVRKACHQRGALRDRAGSPRNPHKTRTPRRQPSPIRAACKGHPWVAT